MEIKHTLLWAYSSSLCLFIIITCDGEIPGAVDGHILKASVAKLVGLKYNTSFH
jgi:hypothetical protein